MMWGIFGLNEETYHQYNKMVINVYVCVCVCVCVCVYLTQGFFGRQESACFLCYNPGTVKVLGALQSGKALSGWGPCPSAYPLQQTLPCLSCILKPSQLAAASQPYLEH